MVVVAAPCAVRAAAAADIMLSSACAAACREYMYIGHITLGCDPNHWACTVEGQTVRRKN